jgi:hypothetical protein
MTTLADIAEALLPLKKALASFAEAVAAFFGPMPELAYRFPRKSSHPVAERARAICVSPPSHGGTTWKPGVAPGRLRPPRAHARPAASQG